MLETILLVLAIGVLVLIAIALVVLVWHTSKSGIQIGRWMKSQDDYHAALDAWIRVVVLPVVDPGGGGSAPPPPPPCKFGDC